MFVMRILIVLVFSSAVCSHVLNTYPLQHIVARDQSNSLNVFDTYLAISDDHEQDGDYDLIQQMQQQIYLKKLHRLPEPMPRPKIGQNAYFLVKTMRQRDKRYISYLTLCHFKICNMGKKRTTRYFHTIRTLDDNRA